MADVRNELMELTRKKYVDQAKWYLNGFWKDGAEQESENIWKYSHKFMELDAKKKAEGNELDEFEAHKFLEFLGETLTVVALREKLRKIDVDANGKMALLEYLMFKYEKSIPEVVNAPQGGNQEEVIVCFLLINRPKYYRNNRETNKSRVSISKVGNYPAIGRSLAI